MAPVMMWQPSARSAWREITASVLINIGMWWKRFLIVVPTLQTPFIPAKAAGIDPQYIPSLAECPITLGAIACFTLLFTLFSRLFPILSIWETVEDAEEAHERDELAAARVRTTRGGVAHAILTTAVLVAGGAVAALTPWTSAGAQAATAEAASAPQPRAQIDLRRTVEDKKEMLVATVSVNGKPVEGASLTFSVSRLFGPMDLGQDQTLDDGTAAVAFPVGLPGDAKGDLAVHVAVTSPAELEGTAVDVKFGGAPSRVWSAQPPRALWSTRAPLAIVGTITLLLATVWTVYAYVVGQLVAMSNLKEES